MQLKSDSSKTNNSSDDKVQLASRIKLNFIIIVLVVTVYLVSPCTGRSFDRDMALIQAKLAGNGNFDDINMKPRYKFKDENDLSEYINELRRRVSYSASRTR